MTALPTSTPTPASKLPLVLEEDKLVTDEKTGSQTRVTRFRRGILVTETKQYSDVRAWAKDISSETPRQCLERQCELLRDRLDAAGFPSDRHPLWMKIEDGAWQEGHSPADQYIGKRNVAFANWYSMMKDLTEPISVEREAGELLWYSLQLLARPGIDEDLWHILQYAQRWSSFRMAGSVNYLANLGMTSRKARSFGPKARRATALEISETIFDLAKEFWENNAHLKKVASCTAEAIKDQVNDRLRSRSLLPAGKEGLSTGTIARYLRKKIGG
jgi:hypothetical protein